MASAGSTWKVSAAVMASRVLGLAREMMFAALYGGSRWMDCFYLAFKTPNLLRDLFAEGALSQAFVTTFSKKAKAEGDASAWPLANKMFCLATIFMSGVTLLGIWLAPWIVELMTLLARSSRSGRGYSAEEVAFTVGLVRVMYPFILLVSLAALVMGLLNARNVFGMPALASCFFNLGSMIGGAAIGWWLDPTWGARSLTGFAWGVLIGGMAQLVCQFPALRRAGYRFVMDFGWRGDSGVRQILRLMGPAVLSASVVQINVVINAMFAYAVGEGAVSWLNYAFRLMQLPIGVFGVAVATVTLPALSRAAVGEIGPEFRPTLAKGMRLVLFLVLPCVLGLSLLAEPIVALLYERRSFDAGDTLKTAAALRAYGFGLLFYSWLKVLQPAFYAIERRWWPMAVSCVALVVNVGLNAWFVFGLQFGHEWLALTTSVTAALSFGILYGVMGKFAGGLESRRLAGMAARLVLPVGAMSALCLAADRWIFGVAAWSGFLWRAATLGGVVAAAAVVYFAAARWMRVPEAEEATSLVLRRFGRR